MLCIINSEINIICNRIIHVGTPELKMATLVLDNGAYTAKIGYSQEKVRSVVSR